MDDLDYEAQAVDFSRVCIYHGGIVLTAALLRYFTLSKTNFFLFRSEVFHRDPHPLLEETYWGHFPNSVFSDCIFFNWDGALHGQPEA